LEEPDLKSASYVHEQIVDALRRHDKVKLALAVSYHLSNLSIVNTNNCKYKHVF
jgi:DNA-binding FadR family transcriptional regulator